MTDIGERIEHLRAAIAAQEALRPTLGDDAVNLAISTLRSVLDELNAQEGGAGAFSRDALRAYLPRELAEKMRAGGRIQGERRRVTVLLADLSGYTAVSERLDPEDVTALSDDVLRELAGAIYLYEGYVETFAGDGAIAVFGAPVAHEDDPERALHAALSMRERMERINRRWQERIGDPMTLHIGVNTGLVVAGDVGPDLRLMYTVMGDTINTASRLMGAAQPGQILVGPETYRVTHAAFIFEALEPMRFKGKREPVAVFELRRARVDPDKGRGLAELGSVFVGRERELAVLRAVAANLRAGHGRVLAIVGEAGLGKSRLMAELRKDLLEDVRWLEGRSFAYSTALAFGPFLDLIRRHAGITDDHSEAEARAHLRQLVDGLFPGDGEAQALFGSLLTMRLSADEEAIVGGMSAERRRNRIFELIGSMFEKLSQTRPTILVVEDAQWADASSVELLEHLMPLAARCPIVIAAIFRSEEDPGPAAFLRAAREGHAERFTSVRLRPLSEAASTEMIARLLLTDALPGPLRTLILNRAEGNPFYLEEVIRSLIERGALVRKPDGVGWVGTPLAQSVSVPDTLQGVLLSRLDRLPDDVRWVLQQASVIGRIFLYRVLSRLADAAELDQDLTYLQREELIRERARHPEVEYIFKHALTQEVAYESLLLSRRRDLHRKVGAAMEEIFADRLGEFQAVIAEHYLRGEAWEKAVDFLGRAGDAAARIYALPEARRYYAEALGALGHLPDNLDNRHRRIDTLINLVAASIHADDPVRNLERLRGAETLVDALATSANDAGAERLRAAWVQNWLGRVHYLRGDADAAFAAYRKALELAQGLGNRELLSYPSCMIGRVLFMQGQFGRALPLLTQAVDGLERTTDWREWGTAMGLRLVVQAAQGAYADSLAAFSRLQASAIEKHDQTGIAGGYLGFAWIYLFGGDYPRMLDAAARAIEQSETSGERIYQYLGLGCRAWAELKLGRLAEAEATRARSRELAEVLTQGGTRLPTFDWWAALDADMAVVRGNPNGGIELARPCVETSQASGALLGQGWAHRVWAQALAALDPPQWDEAEAHLAQSLAAFETGEVWLEAARTHAIWARLCRQRGDPARALDHVEKAAARFDAAGLPGEW